MPGGNFWSDKCQEDKCPDEFFGRTNARRTNAWSQFLIGQMPGGQMPEPTFGPDKCLNPHWSWEGGRTNASTDKCLEDKCLDGQMPVLAFVLQGICLLRHLSANWYHLYHEIIAFYCHFILVKIQRDVKPAFHSIDWLGFELFRKVGHPWVDAKYMARWWNGELE